MPKILVKAATYKRLEAESYFGYFESEPYVRGGGLVWVDVDSQLYSRLRAVMTEEGLKTFDEVVTHLLDEHGKR